MEHAIHLGAPKFVKKISPTAGGALLKKVHKAFKSAQDMDCYDLLQLDANLMDFDDEDPEQGENDDENDWDGNFDVGDACGKALTLVKQVD